MPMWVLISFILVMVLAIAIGAIALLWWGCVQMIPPTDEID